MKPEVIGWTESGAVRLLDQTRLPNETHFMEIDQVDQMISAIKALSVRGAPLIGVAAAMGLAAAAARLEKQGNADLHGWFVGAAKSLAACFDTRSQ